MPSFAAPLAGHGVGERLCLGGRLAGEHRTDESARREGFVEAAARSPFVSVPARRAISSMSEFVCCASSTQCARSRSGYDASASPLPRTDSR